MTSIPVAEDDQPSAYASDLLVDRLGSRFRLFGNSQTHAGARFAPSSWVSADGLHWSQADTTSMAIGQSSVGNAAAAWGDGFVVGGWVDDEDGRHPAVWLAPPGATFGAVEHPFSGNGTIEAVAASPDGGVVAVGFVTTPTSAHQPVFVRRAPAGSWSVTAVPSAGDGAGNAGDANVGLSGVGVIGDHVVVTGWAQTTGFEQAASWVSVDGGTSFVAVDTSVFAAPRNTAFGVLATWSTGFIAAACLADDNGTAVQILTSPDGAAWSALAVTVGLEHQPFTRLGADCSSLTTTPTHAVLGILDITGSVLVVDATGAGSVTDAPRTPLQVSTQAPLGALGLGVTVSVGRQERGLAANVVGGGRTTDADGLPVGGPSSSSVSISPVIGGVSAAVTIFPVVTERGADGYSWRTEPHWFSSADLTTWLADDSFAGQQISTVTSSGTVDVGFAVGDEPGGHHGSGPTGDAIALSRHDGEAWQSHGVISGGRGAQWVLDAHPVGDGFVAVGVSAVYDSDTGATASTALALSSIDGEHWGSEKVPSSGGETSLATLCELPGGALLGLGSSRVDGAKTGFAALRSTDGTWHEVAAADALAGFVDDPSCASNGTVTVIVDNSAGRRQAVSTVDGTTFTPADLGSGGTNTTFDGIVSANGIFVAGGLAPDRGAQRPQLWTSTDGVRWTPVTVDGWTASVTEDVSAVTTVGGRIVLSGVRDRAATLWSVPINGLQVGT